jgi:uncharacterized membrane-anchored protein YitT (DUF2179 family)
MSIIEKTTGEINDYLIDHPQKKKWLHWLWLLVVEAISGFIFAYGFKAFINPPSGAVKIWMSQEQAKIASAAQDGITIYPTITQYDVTSPSHLISGGASGLSQVIVKILNCFVNVNGLGGEGLDVENLIISILYFVINIPLFILSWRKISKQFTIFTFFNVLFASLFMKVIPDSMIANVINIYSDILVRAIFGGLTTGIASGIAMLVGSCGGGSDILTIYFSEKKSTSVGKYSLFINCTIFFLYVLFSVIGHAVHPEWNTQDNNTIISLALYTVVYSFVSAKTLDFINQKNKKQELQIFTSNENLSTVLVRAFPHSATTIESKGAFSGKKNFMIYMVISKSEQKKATQLIKQADPQAFFTVSDLNQVYGRFYIKPLD